MRSFVISPRKFIWVKQHCLFWWCIRCLSNENDGYLPLLRSFRQLCARLFALYPLMLFYILFLSVYSFFYRFILFSIGSFFFLSDCSSFYRLVPLVLFVSVFIRTFFICFRVGFGACFCVLLHLYIKYWQFRCFCGILNTYENILN